MAYSKVIFNNNFDKKKYEYIALERERKKDACVVGWSGLTIFR